MKDDSRLAIPASFPTPDHARDMPGSFDYQIKQEVVKGLTLEFWPCVQQGVVLSFRFFFACLLDV